MTSSATSGRHLSKFKKNGRNAASDGLGSNLSGLAFCLPHQLVGVLLLMCAIIMAIDIIICRDYDCWTANDFYLVDFVDVVKEGLERSHRPIDFSLSPFLPLDEAVASRAVFPIVSGRTARRADGFQ